MIGRAVALILALGLVAAPLAAAAQQAGKVCRVGILVIAPGSHGEKAFRHGLRDLGWIEGQNIILEQRYYQARFGRLSELAAELVSLNVDAIVAWSAHETGAAKHATKTIPIVFLVHGDPVVTGHVASLAKPGGNGRSS